VHGYLEIMDKPAGKHKIPITLINGKGDGPTLVINGGEHGSEYNGPAGAIALMKELEPEHINGKVIIVPMVNTLAFESKWMHGNPIDYKDLTGYYVEEIPRGGSGHPKVTYYVTTTFYREVLAQADYRINLHGGDIEEDLMTGTMYRQTGDKEKDKLNLSVQSLRMGVDKGKQTKTIKKQDDVPNDSRYRGRWNGKMSERHR